MNKNFKKVTTGVAASLSLFAAMAPIVANADVNINDSKPQMTSISNEQSLIADEPVHGVGNIQTNFDLSNIPPSGKSQTVQDENGNVTTVVVTPQFDPLTRVSNGTYKVNAWGIGWSVTFYINVSSNTITKANNLDYIIAMPVKSAKLSIDSSKQATARFGFSTPIYDILNWTGWVRVNINGSNNLVVSHN
ncbi:DUF5626 family protein [Lactococcus sp. DD01]|uniref:DUF5626 family protein n=1 Tax=Lactococcus sp. DD01 TaxID=1776443 RepID=UPI000776983B|nr:DUF5626 family protein [Lactococcus sp. DD01]KXT59190.1 hypothetical protein LACDD01_02188 [Lactococcus sp. DD01]